MNVVIGKFSYSRQMVTKAIESVLPNNMVDYLFTIDYLRQNLDGMAILEKNAAIIQLDGSLEQVFSKFHSTCRKHVRRSFRNPDLVFHETIPDWDAYYEFHCSCEAERGWYPVPKEELQASTCFLSSFDGLPLAGISYYSCEEGIRLGRIFSRRRSDDLNHIPSSVFSSASRRIVYEICRIGIEQQLQFVDLGGIDLNDPSKSGIATFKLYFGSEVKPVQIGRWETDSFGQFRKEISAKKIDIT